MPKKPLFDITSLAAGLVNETSLARQAEQLARGLSIGEAFKSANQLTRFQEQLLGNRLSATEQFAQYERDALDRVATVRRLAEDPSLNSAIQYASTFDAQLQQVEDHIKQLHNHDSPLVSGLDGLSSVVGNSLGAASVVDAYLEQVEDAAHRFRESPAWDDIDAASRWAVDAERVVQARAWAEPSLAAIAALQPSWERLLGTTSVRSAVDAWQEASAVQTALNALDSPGDLIARVSGVASMTRLQEQIMGWHGANVPAWSEAARLFQVVDWQAILAGDEEGEEECTEPGKALTSTELPLPSFWQRLSPEARLFAFLMLLQMMLGDNWLPRLEEHFRALPRAEAQHSPIPAPATTRDWAALAAPTPLMAEPEAGAETLLTLQAGAWVRVLDDKPGWLLVEAETGHATKVTGWIRKQASQRWNERLFEEAFQQLQASLPKASVSEPTLPSKRIGPDVDALPAVIAVAGTAAEKRYVEYFTASLRNRNTRAAYWHACNQFLGRCEEAGLTLDAIQPVHVAGYIEHLSQGASAPTVKQHLAAIRRMFDFLVVGQILPANPAASVRGPKHVVSEGKTPILETDEVRALFAQFDPGRLIDLRDRAILGTMVYTFARVGALVKLRVKDYYRQGARAWFVLDEKGGKQNRVPAHHLAAEYVEQYIAAAGIELQRDMPLFRSMGRGRGGKAVIERGLRREEIFAMVRRRAAAVGLPPEIGCHSFRGTGITSYLKNGGTLETAARLAGHASTRTTQLYDRRLAEVAQTEVERIRF